MARLRSAPSSQQPAPTKQSTRQALKEKTNTTAVGASTANDVTDFVKDARPTRTRARKAVQNEDELVMAGGLGQMSDAIPSEAPMTTDELAKSDGPAPPTAKANRRPPRQARKPAQSEAQSKVFEDMKKRMRATAQKEAISDKIVDVPAVSSNVGPSSDSLPNKPPLLPKSDATVAERSELSISPSPPPPGNVSAVKHKRSSTARPESVLKSQSTPAAESSVLALKNFKRRPRQPSMLAMVQQRTAGARTSTAHGHATEDEGDDRSVFDIGGDEEDEEEFAPDAEGTPLHLRKAKRVSAISQKGAPSTSKRKADAGAGAQSRKRNSDEAEVSSSALSALRAKRQKAMAPADDVAATLDLPPSSARRTSPDRQATPQPDARSEVQVINSSPSTTTPTEASFTIRRRRSPSAEIVVPSTEEQDQQGEQISLNNIDDVEEQVPLDDTMANPASSSPLPEDPISTQGTDIMAEPLTQMTPPRPKPDRKKAEKKTQCMTTATLQSLLPKRRQPLKPRHRKSEYDIDSESDDDGAGAGENSEDDAGEGRSRRRTKASSTKNRKPNNKSKASNAPRKPTAPPRSTQRPAAPAKRRKTATSSRNPSAKTGRTYGRNTASDKENNDANSDFEELSDNDDSALPDTSLTMHQAEVSGELAAAKAKFAQVDDWDMEFESVSFEEGRSSSQTWR